VNVVEEKYGPCEETKVEFDLGARLRYLRQRHQLTMRELAVKSGLSINTLSMIENSKTSPSISTIQQISQALDVPLVSFFETHSARRRIVHVRQGDRPKVNLGSTLLEQLGKELVDSEIQPFVVTLDPGVKSGKKPIIHTGHEFVYCLSGQIQYTIEDENYLLNPGDSLVFESPLSHHWQNVSKQVSQFILVLCPSDDHDTPVEIHFPLE
jgi:transcriptional regulator with XRE-family HTH domain